MVGMGKSGNITAFQLELVVAHELLVLHWFAGQSKGKQGRLGLNRFAIAFQLFSIGMQVTSEFFLSWEHSTAQLHSNCRFTGFTVM